MTNPQRLEAVPDLDTAKGDLTIVVSTPNEADLVRIWDSGSFRIADTQTFQTFCVRTYGKKSGEARRIMVRVLRERGLSLDEIAHQTGASFSAISGDVRLLEGVKRPRKRKDHLAEPEPDPERERRRELRKRNKDIGDHHAELLYAAMRNAPAGSRSIPMMNRATAAVQALTELSVLDPEVAASQVAGVRVREYSNAAQLGAWLTAFAQACEERRQAEFPHLGHLPWSPKWTPEGKANGEHSPVARAVLDLLAICGRATEAELGVGIATANIGRVLRDLTKAGHITIDADGVYTRSTD
jgi:hypothetical protein